MSKIKNKFSLEFKIEFKKQDMWIGVFWKKSIPNQIWDIWICLIPCLPLHISKRWF